MENSYCDEMHQSIVHPVCLTRIFKAYVNETVCDEQISKVLEPVLLRINNGEFDEVY